MAEPTHVEGAAEAAHEPYKLPIQGFKGTPAEIERQWYEQCYIGRGDRMWQLTFRAVIMGSLLGGVLSLTNLYIGLKAGWAFGVAITACILSYAIWTTFHAIGLVRTPMTILENNCMQSTASSAGYSTGGTLISAFAAYVMLNGQHLPLWTMLAWVFFLAVLGVTMAVPMKRQMINVDQLRFPSGVAAAETLTALHSTGSVGMRSAKALGIAGLIAGVHKLWWEGLSLMWAPLKSIQLDHWFGMMNGAWDKALGGLWAGRTVYLSLDPIFLAAGAITGLRVCSSMMLGAVLCWMVYIPIVHSYGLIERNSFSGNVQWSLWAGTACMVTSGLLSFGLQWRSALRAFSGLGRMLFAGSNRRSAGAPCAVCGRGDTPLGDRFCANCGAELRTVEQQMESIETPASWFLGGQLIALLALSALAHYSFGMPFWQSLLAVVLSFALALVACRVTGETDTTPVGAMGKITQLTFGIVHPAKVAGDLTAMNVNLMAANITAGAAGSSADLLTDLKSGYLLGAHPRRQFIAQFCGIFIGTVVTVFAFTLLVRDPSILGTERFPAPAALTWKGVAEAMGGGLQNLHPIKLWGIAIGGAVGLILPILGLIFPKQAKYMPSAAGLGLSWVFPWTNALDFFLGSVIGYVFMRKAPKAAEEYTFPVASGLIAGGSLMGVVLILWGEGPELFEALKRGIMGG
ncbi:MAG TPA: OPT family oligopeptide transporter [Phycisphaerae bacterium]|nr:OPT family oligopeptide transporter [Phycisphaerae bacterium]